LNNGKGYANLSSSCANPVTKLAIILAAITLTASQLTNALAYAGRTESTVLQEEPETLDAEMI